MGKLRFREVKRPAQGYAAMKGWDWDSDPETFSLHALAIVLVGERKGDSDKVFLSLLNPTGTQSPPRERVPHGVSPLLTPLLSSLPLALGHLC